MKTSVLDSKQLDALIQKETQADKTCVAPVAGDHGVSLKPVSHLEGVTLDFVTTKNSIKEFFFPATETILEYTVGTHELVGKVEPALKPLIVFGVKPCDAVSLPIIDAVFKWDYLDNFYLKRRDAALIITQACTQKNNTCFCTSVGLSTTATQGSDILFYKQGDQFFMIPVTPKGEDWLKQSGAAPAEVPSDLIKKAEQNNPENKFDLSKIKPWLDESFEEKAFWVTISERCIGCGVCTYVCPTCHCFDIIDEGSSCQGCRVKNWDSCSFGLFTQHASGHNPRRTPFERWRQRIMHKFKYYQDNFQQTLCTGCGRCVDQCPVSMGVLETLCAINEKNK